MSLSLTNVGPPVVLYHKQSSSNLDARHRAMMASSPGALFISMIVVGFRNFIDWNVLLVDAVHLRGSHLGNEIPIEDETLILGRFRLLDDPEHTLGEGSYSIARRAIDMQTDEAVCVKVYKKFDEKRRRISESIIKQKFDRQVAVLGRLAQPLTAEEKKKVFGTTLNHSFRPEVDPASVFEKLVAFGEEKGEYHVVTELAAPSEGLRCKGYRASLKDYLTAIREGVVAPPTFPEIQEITKAVVLGGAMLHAKGLVHLDFKPENLLKFGTTWKWIDMDGCIEMWTGDGPTRIEEIPVFTEVYCAPELIRFAAFEEEYLEMNGRLDVWSVGLSLCELATLRPVLVPKYEEKGALHYDVWLAEVEDKDLTEIMENLHYPFIDMSSWKDLGENKEKSQLSLFVDLLKKMLATHSCERQSFAECLDHHFLGPWTPEQILREREASDAKEDLGPDDKTRPVRRCLPFPDPRVIFGKRKNRFA